MIVIEQSAAAIIGKRHEVNVKFLIEGASLIGHVARDCRRVRTQNQLCE
jgi:hypothetical protein